MKIANARLKMDTFGSDVPVTGITPAEALVLGMDHMPHSNDYPLSGIEETGEVARSPLDEIKRLRARYGKARIKQLFPGAIPQVPETFEEAKAAVVEAASEGELDAGPGTFFGAAAEADALAKKALEAKA